MKNIRINYEDLMEFRSLGIMMGCLDWGNYPKIALKLGNFIGKYNDRKLCKTICVNQLS
jgi:hypothetical protein